MHLDYKINEHNNISFTAGRRIDRPSFQTLNPFTFIINKYTFQTGNSFIVPQFSTNLEAGYRNKEWLSTVISYSIVKNYFSQIFLRDTVTGLLYYSQGNVGRTQNLGLGATVMLTPVKWWSFTLQGNFNHKQLKGFANDISYTSGINQFSVNTNNQFSFAKVYTAELSGFFTSRARNDLQEVLYPTGQLSVRISRPLLKKKATLKLSARDLFYTNAMEGFIDFPNATEYFFLRRDSRSLSIAFSYRFGKAFKAARRSSGSAADEMQRVGN